MFERIKAIATDVDGVLTDGNFWWGAGGEELKRFSFADVTGIAMAREAGLKLALISGESSQAGMSLVQRYADKLKITDVYKGCHDKAAAVTDFAEKYDLQLSEVCFVGDDLPDLPALTIVGVAATPADAQNVAKEKAHYIAQRSGGTGVLREIIESTLREQNQL